MSANVSTNAASIALEAEIARWSRAGKPIRLFLRDDDAISDTPNLRGLAELCDRYEAPLLLAAIPSNVRSSLADLVEDFPLITPAVHGYAHVSHSPPGEKPCELDRFRRIDEVADEMQRARSLLIEQFGARISGLLVPPWNRIHEEVLPHVRDAGFSGVSAHGWTSEPTSVNFVNVHVDIIHWSAGNVGRSHAWVYSEIARNLGIAREKGWRPVGVLSHHLDHDEQAWRVIEDLMAIMLRHRAVWIAADDILLEMEESR